MSNNGLRLLSRDRALRAAGAAVLVAGALTVPATSAAAASACPLTVLPVPAGTFRSGVTAGDPTGRYLIGDAAVSVDGQTTLVSLLWRGGRLVDLRTPYPQPILVDVNAAGTVVGHSVTESRTTAFRYQHGRFTTLPGLNPEDGTAAVAVNGRGDVLGYSVEPDLDRHVVLWPAHRPRSPRELVAPVTLNAVDLDDDGTALGSNVGAQANTYLWTPDGTARQVRGPSGSTDVLAVAIRRGWLGGIDNHSTTGDIVAWRTRGGPVNTAPNVIVYTVNGHGDLGLQDAIDRRRGGLITVPGLGGPTGVTVLSDRGPAAGFADDGAQVHAVTWRGC
jgi:probable HAF family extracellular repeat protein